MYDCKIHSRDLVYALQSLKLLITDYYDNIYKYIFCRADYSLDFDKLHLDESIFL